MSQTITYKCDRCGNWWDTDEKGSEGRQLWNIEFSVKCCPVAPDAYRYAPVVAEWCRTCVTKYFLVGGYPKDDAGNPVKPDYESVLREIVCEELENQQQ